MKKLSVYLLLSAVMLLCGCYTQLALRDDKTEGVPERQPSEKDETLPVGVIVEPIYIPIAPPYCPPPFVGVVAPGIAAPPPAESPIRDIGNHRSEPNRSESSPANVRTTGATRGGR